MVFIKLRRKVPSQTSQSNKSNGDETKDLFWKVPPRVKVMTLLRTTEKVKRESQKLASQYGLFLKRASRMSSLIRIQLEETKRKVGFYSPAALRFIGPGDR
jgi:hypothetical protein